MGLPDIWKCLHLKVGIMFATAARTTIARLMSAAALSAALLSPTSASAEFELTSFRQSVAETAARDDGLAAFYRGQSFDGLWVGSDAATQARRNALLTALSEAPLHGLPALRYDLDGLVADLQAARTPEAQGRMDVELSRIFLQYANDIHGGILDPNDTIRAIKRDGPDLDEAQLLADFMATNAPDAFLRDLAPSSPEYVRLMRQKLALESLILTGGWGPAVTGGSLGPGASGSQVVLLRNRLMAMGYLDRSVTQTYDDAMVSAVRAFQSAHGMTADGVAGAATLQALNVSAASRLEQVLVAMERERWTNFERGDRHIWVNLTDFHATVVDFDRVTFSTRSVIGATSADRASPEFSDVMTHMVINPSWYIPRSIIVNEYLPALRSNSGAHGHLQIINSRGQVVSRNQDFSRYSASSFPFSMRQPPSPSNALGRVKFMFPNQWNIYLHDTPAQSLFAREVRAFSHGCIRLDDPYDFAYHLLAAQEDSPVDYFHSILNTGAERQVDLVVPVPVHLVYRTAFTNVQGELQFRNDIYGRDARIWRALSEAGVEIGGVQG